MPEQPREAGYDWLHTFGSDYAQYKFEPQGLQTTNAHGYFVQLPANGDLRLISDQGARITIPIKEGKPDFAAGTVRRTGATDQKLTGDGDTSPAADNADDILDALRAVPGVIAPSKADFLAALKAPAPKAAAAVSAPVPAAAKPATVQPPETAIPPAAVAAATGAAVAAGASTILPAAGDHSPAPTPATAAPAWLIPPPPPARAATLPAAHTETAGHLHINDFRKGDFHLSEADKNAAKIEAQKLVNALQEADKNDPTHRHWIELRVLGTADPTAFSHASREKSERLNHHLAEERAAATARVMRTALKDLGVPDSAIHVDRANGKTGQAERAAMVDGTIETAHPAAVTPSSRSAAPLPVR